MMDEKRPRASSTAHEQPESQNAAVVDDVQSNQGVGENSNSRIVAFEVALCRGDSRLRLTAPLVGGGKLVIEQLKGANTIEAFDLLIPLPIKDLANPGVALVVRSSLERLVKAARALTSRICDNIPPTRDEVRSLTGEVVAALEPFAEVGHG